MVYPAPDLLVLDEVSTHLDMDTVAALITALRNYSGAIVVISHDRHLMRCVVEGAQSVSSDSESEEDDGREEELRKGAVYMVSVKGNLKLLRDTDEYVAIVERHMRKEGLL